MIRPARRADAGAVALQIRETLPEPWTVPQVEAELGLAASRGWVAEEGSRAEIKGALLARRSADELEILQLAVAPRGGRRGIGTALVEHAIRAEPGLRVVHLEVREDNRGARAFYRTLRFEERGRRAGYYRDGMAAIGLHRSSVLSAR